jgi:hypothetical protein
MDMPNNQDASIVRDEYDELFDEYVKALRTAKGQADEWWERTLEIEAVKVGTSEAEGRLRLRWPLGPAAHPRIVAVYREFYLRCESITEKLLETGGPSTRIVDPGSFVTELLLGPKNGDLAVTVSHLPYAPLGQDEEGNTI